MQYMKIKMFSKPLKTSVLILTAVAALAVAANAQNEFGPDAGNGTMTGGANTGNGYVALSRNTTGSYNTANGVGALFGNTTGNFNMAMGLAAHLEGVMNGIFLVAVGAVWAEVRLSPRLKAVAFWSALYGTYANWTTTLLAAIFGTAAMSPITGAGHSAQSWQESVVTFGFMTVGSVIVACSVLILWGLRRDKREKENRPPSP
jgi:(hydroxyamino)benzene mutase